ncbi:N-acetylglucosamine kinase-like BadF-type ATPase [Winogradskyella wandonensis]|uniref:N-acetylglucosamine kinase-like BadF-type ATPase n=1 Tax=Winogradskyella wandonensis TaxID=1442586 RepID=A0A4R1KVF9_9FLAO|nr:BadF/BadG/BcrA/BcrD ATPase family protein [Winogradskyella wandonensis]TCK69165.1 N-acetylglucosamine kinase-like BadF-type ATPase [Winogradskyella wandonensis]
MILITDGGSTKCDWIAINSDGQLATNKIRTKGLNPAILEERKLRKILKKSDELQELKREVTHVFFYGAGCGTEKPKQTLTEVLQDVFVNANVEVQEDTMAAVRSSLNHNEEAAVVCIMGTGSNCSYFDGKKLHQRVKSLGYSIMDDASGNYYGKQLLRDYYFNKMPDTIRLAFEHKYNLDADYIKFNLYKQANPNAYLASFAEFMFLNKDSEYIHELIKQGLRVFTESMILQFKEELKTVPVHFAGSIAFFAQEEIHEVAKEYGYTVGNFVRRPIDGLVDYHINNL